MDRPDGTRCANCGVALTGIYCHACGQKHEPRIRSLGHFIADAAENLTHVDSRLWRTLLPLLFRPGFLTREFFAGRRARYLPPIRLYLVVSLLFFVVAGALPEQAAPVRVDLALRGDAAGGDPPTATTARAQDRCRSLRVTGVGSDWLRPRLVATCERIERDGADALVDAFVHNLPRALFVFLPLVAALMQLLYWRPRRAYVEHLLFLVHNHAAVFLSSILLMLVATLPGASTPVNVVAVLYFAWYFHRALRRFHGEGRAATALKYFVIALTYLLLGGVMLVATALYSAVTL